MTEDNTIDKYWESFYFHIFVRAKIKYFSVRLIKLCSCGPDCSRDHSIWSVVSQKGNIFPTLVSPEGIPSSTNSCQMSATRLAIIPQYSTGFNFIGNTFFLKICGIFIQPDGKHITVKVGTWITAFAKDYKGYLQYDKIQGCDEHCNVCNMTVAPSNLTVLTPPPSVEQELKHTAQHTLCYTLILTNI